MASWVLQSQRVQGRAAPLGPAVETWVRAMRWAPVAEMRVQLNQRVETRVLPTPEQAPAVEALLSMRVQVRVAARVLSTRGRAPMVEAWR